MRPPARPPGEFWRFRWADAVWWANRMAARSGVRYRVEANTHARYGFPGWLAKPVD